VSGVVLWTIVAYVFVLGTMALLAWVLYELSPFARHEDVYRRH
jgi:hypothetical protein